MLLRLTNDCLILNDLHLKVNNTLFQIDTLLITQKKIFIFEVKNYEGDYYIKDNRLHMLNGKEIKNPLIQISRSESLFRQLLQELKINIPVESLVIFINPKFYLYEAPVNAPLVFHAQLDRFLKKVEVVAASGVSGNNYELAKKLASLQITKNPYSRLPNYTYEGLEKGIVCRCGCAFMDIANQNQLICPSCGELENKESAVLRAVREFSLLFPDRKITTNNTMDWCGIISRKRVRKILLTHFTLIRKAKASYYVYPKDKQGKN